MDEDLFFAMIGAIVVGLLGMWVFGWIAGIVGLVIGFILGANFRDWLERQD